MTCASLSRTRHGACPPGPAKSRLLVSANELAVRRHDQPELASVVRFNVSPKLANSGVEEARRIKPDILRQFAATPGVAFKFVVTGLEDRAGR